MKPIVLAVLVSRRWRRPALSPGLAGSRPDRQRARVRRELPRQACGSASARKTCVGVDLGACLGLDDAPKTIKTNGFGHPRDCAAIERQIWDGWLNRWYGEALKKIPAPAVDKLKAAQRAWIAWRDAGCAVDGDLHPWPLGDDNEQTCLMEETASRALDLRDMAEDDYGQ